MLYKILRVFSLNYEFSDKLECFRLKFDKNSIDIMWTNDFFSSKFEYFNKIVIFQKSMMMVASTIFHVLGRIRVNKFIITNVNLSEVPTFEAYCTYT